MRIGLAAFGLSVLLPWTCAVAAPKFRERVEEARAEAVNASKEVILYFSASWCGWCRRMESEVFPHAEIEELANRYAWVKIDIEANPELAARFRVRSVPALIRLGAEDEVVATTVGRLSLSKLRNFLEPAKPDAKGNVSAGNSQPQTDSIPAAVSLLEIQAGVVRGESASLLLAVDRLARSDRAQRDELLRLLGAADRSLWPELWRLMQSERLARRAAAAEALETAAHAGLPFQPFAVLEKRQRQIDAWKQWLEDHGVSVQDVRSPETTPAEAEIPGTIDGETADSETLQKRTD